MSYVNNLCRLTGLVTKNVPLLYLGLRLIVH